MRGVEQESASKFVETDLHLDSARSAVRSRGPSGATVTPHFLAEALRVRDGSGVRN